jgi:hypothetical protein
MINLKNFKGGINTYKDDDQLDKSEARDCRNYFVGTGSLEPMPNKEGDSPSDELTQCKLDNPTCPYVEYRNPLTDEIEIYTSCDDGKLKIKDGRVLGLEKPTKNNFKVTQIKTPGSPDHYPEVIGPSEDGSGNFNAAGIWIQTEYPQSNTWTFTNLDTGATSTTVDTWVICDTPPFNLTEYYSLLYNQPALFKSTTGRNEYGCVDGAGGTFPFYDQVTPQAGGAPAYLTEPTTYAIAWWNEDTKTQSTLSEACEFTPQPVIKTRRWHYGPTSGGIDTGGFWTTELPVPQDSRGSGTRSDTYTGTSWLHQVRITVGGRPTNATHAIIYQRVRGEYLPVAKITSGDFDVNATTDYDDPDLRNIAPVFRDFGTPPENLQNLVLSESGVMAGTIGNTVYMSEPFKFDLWSEDYEFPIKHRPIALHTIFNEFLVVTEGNPVRLVGQLPGRITRVELPDAERGYTAKSTADMGRRIVWVGPEGIAHWDGSTVATLSRANLSKNEWLDIISDTSTLCMVGTEELAILFYSNSAAGSGGLVVDFRPESASITKTDLYTSYAVFSVVDAAIYSVDNWSYKTNQGPPTSPSLEGYWQSGKIYTGNQDRGFNYARVYADGQVELTITNDKGYSKSFIADRNQPFPIGFDGVPVRGHWLQFELRGKSTISKVQIAEDSKSLRTMR